MKVSKKTVLAAIKEKHPDAVVYTHKDDDFNVRFGVTKEVPFEKIHKHNKFAKHIQKLVDPKRKRIKSIFACSGVSSKNNYTVCLHFALI